VQLTLSWDKAFQVSTIPLLKANSLMSSLVRFLNNLHERSATTIKFIRLFCPFRVQS